MWFILVVPISKVYANVAGRVYPTYGENRDATEHWLEGGSEVSVWFMLLEKGYAKLHGSYLGHNPN